MTNLKQLQKEIVEEFGQKFPNKIAEVIDDFGSSTKADIKDFIQSALTRQLEHLKGEVEKLDPNVTKYFEAAAEHTEGYNDAKRDVLTLLEKGEEAV